MALGYNERNWPKEYWAWRHMKQRCYNPNDSDYHNYGARGIIVCKQWKDNFGQFLDDVGECPGLGYSLDRINNNGNYEPGNIRWATAKQQSRNTRRCKLTEDEAYAIKYLSGEYTQKYLADAYEVSQNLISMIQNGRAWRDI